MGRCHVRATELRVTKLAVLPVLYRKLMSLTRRRGLITLSKIHNLIFANPQLVKVHGSCWILLRNEPHLFGFLCGIHEQHVADALNRFIKPGDVCIDVGANIGYFSVLMSRLSGPEGVVYAFEPETENFKLLQTNAELDENYPHRFFVEKKAVSESSGIVYVKRSSQSTQHEIVDRRTDALEQRVQSVSLDDFCRGPIRLIKVDVEGHEGEVVRGALGLIGRGDLDVLLIEVTPGAQAEELYELLSPLTCRILVWREGEWSEFPLDRIDYRTDALVVFNE